LEIIKCILLGVKKVRGKKEVVSYGGEKNCFYSFDLCERGLRGKAEAV